MAVTRQASAYSLLCESAREQHPSRPIPVVADGKEPGIGREIAGSDAAVRALKHTAAAGVIAGRGQPTALQQVTFSRLAAVRGKFEKTDREGRWTRRTAFFFFAEPTVGRGGGACTQERLRLMSEGCWIQYCVPVPTTFVLLCCLLVPMGWILQI